MTACVSVIGCEIMIFEEFKSHSTVLRPPFSSHPSLLTPLLVSSHTSLSLVNPLFSYQSPSSPLTHSHFALSYSPTLLTPLLTNLLTSLSSPPPSPLLLHQEISAFIPPRQELRPQCRRSIQSHRQRLRNTQRPKEKVRVCVCINV